MPQRARYYQGMIDLEIFENGMSYKELKDSTVIFICMFDPFGLDLPIYSFTDICVENRDLTLDTNSFKIFINVMTSSNEISEDMKNLISYMRNHQVEDELTDAIEKCVDNIQSSTQWRLERMKELFYEQDIREDAWAGGKAEGLRDGREEERTTAIRKLLDKGFEKDFILSLDYTKEEYDKATGSLVEC